MTPRTVLRKSRVRDDRHNGGDQEFRDLLRDRRSEGTERFRAALQGCRAMFTIDDARAFLAKNTRRRQANKVLHGHPSPLFWRERDLPLEERLQERRDANIMVPKNLGVYVATPYCLPTDPDRCGFCLFPSETYRGRAQLETYRRYLEREVEMLRPWFAGDHVTSVYFGGGTANLYPAAVYPELPRLVERLTGAPLSGAEMTLEGIPQLFTRDKIAAIKEGGFTRVSMGVQQIDDDMIALSGRKQTAKHVWQTIEWCAEADLSLSVDLIFGWPNQTEARMVADLERVVAAGVRHITHYELNVAGRSDFARNHRDSLPSIEENQHLYRVGKQVLTEAGYRQATVYDWEKEADGSARYRFEEDLHRTFLVERDELRGNEMLGLGYAGVCNFPGTPDDPGVTYFNHTNLDAYFAALDARKWPVERGFSFATEDLRLVWLFQTMQTLSIDTEQYRCVFGTDVRADFGAAVEALEERGWATQAGAQIEIIGDGELMVPTIQALFAQPRTDDLRRSASAPPPGMKAARRAGRGEERRRLPVC